MGKTHKKIVTELLLALEIPLRSIAQEDGQLPRKVAKAIHDLAEQIDKARTKQSRQAAVAEQNASHSRALAEELTQLLGAHLAPAAQDSPKANRLIAAAAEKLASQLTRLPTTPLAASTVPASPGAEEEKQPEPQPTRRKAAKPAGPKKAAPQSSGK
jgi:hypothetical protein